MKLSRRVGSPQIIQSFTLGYRRAAALAKSARSDTRVGTQFDGLKPLAHPGVARIWMATRILYFAASLTAASRSAGHTYAGSDGSCGCAGRVGATFVHAIAVCQIPAPRSW